MPELCASAPTAGVSLIPITKYEVRGHILGDRTFLAHVTRLSACEGGDGDDVTLVECSGSDGSYASWPSPPEAAPELGELVRVTLAVVG